MPPVVHEIAQAILDGKLDLIAGCREMVSTISGAGLERRELFQIFVAVDSETDDVPVGSVRDLWEPTALAKKEEAVRGSVNTARPQVFAACREVLRTCAGADDPIQ